MDNPARFPSLTPAELAVEVHELTKRFGRVPVLDALSLSVESGRITALVGPNGAGKTTLLKALLGLVRPDVGHVRVAGTDVTADSSYRSRIGFMPQLPRFPAHLSGAEIARMLDDLRGFSGEPDEELLDALALRDDMAKPFRTLSGGTRQKVNAALAFRYRTPILVLDEPTAGLDPVSSMALKDKVRARRDEGCTVIVTSHNLADLQALADRVAFLVDGRLRFSGTLPQLLDETGRSSLEEAIADLMLRRTSISSADAAAMPPLAELGIRAGVA